MFKRGGCAEKEREAADKADSEVVSSDAPVVDGRSGRGGPLGDKGASVGRGGRIIGPEGQRSGMSRKPMGRGLGGCCVPAHPGQNVLFVSVYVLTGACMRQVVWATLRKEEAPDSASSGPVALELAQGCSKNQSRDWPEFVLPRDKD